MNKATASRTALGTSLMRALHARKDPRPLIHDIWGEQLVPKSVVHLFEEHAMKAVPHWDEIAAKGYSGTLVEYWLRSNPAYATVITRSRYTEDALEAAIARGVTQYVILGAGFDSYALRWAPSGEHLRIYEIDHPATQDLKVQRIQECGIVLPESLQLLAADLSVESIDKILQRSSFDGKHKSFFSWLGVTMYLSREANLESFRAMARSVTAESELVFTYHDLRAIELHDNGKSRLFSELQDIVSAMGEPFISGFHPDELERTLRSVGWHLLEDMDDAQLVERYDADDENGFRPHTFSRIAWARTCLPKLGSPSLPSAFCAPI